MQNSKCLELLRPIFAPKMKTAPPPNGIGELKLWRACCYEGLVVIWTRHVEFFVFWSSPKVGQEKWLNFGKDLSFFFGDHLISAGKTVLVLWRRFFLEITWFWQKNSLNLIQDRWKFGSNSFTAVFTSQKSPPPPSRNPGYAPGPSSVTVVYRLAHFWPVAILVVTST